MISFSKILFEIFLVSCIYFSFDLIVSYYLQLQNVGLLLNYLYLSLILQNTPIWLYLLNLHLLIFIYHSSSILLSNLLFI